MRRLPRIRDYDNLVLPNGARKCRNCDKQVGRGRRYYCSEECLREFTEDHTWAPVRAFVLKRDRYRCSICNQRLRKSRLDVDHIVPIRMGGNPYDKENLRTLCKDCHKAKTRLDSWALNLNRTAP